MMCHYHHLTKFLQDISHLFKFVYESMKKFFKMADIEFKEGRRGEWETEGRKLEHFIVQLSRGTYVENNGPLNHYNELAITSDEKYWIMKLL
jgi:hypothetical protein